MAPLSPIYRPASFAKIIKSILLADTEDKESVHRFSCAYPNFVRVERFLKAGKNDGRPYASLCFNAGQRTLQLVAEPSPMYIIVCHWFSIWAYELPGVQLSTFVECDSILEDFHGQFFGSYKIADGAFYPCLGRKWPTIALEVGYTASYEDLVRNAMLLIKGSNGGIGLVILVKLQPLKEDETEIQKGGLEVWGYEHKRKDCFRLEHQQLYPRPSYHARQKVTLSWQNLLREHEQSLNPEKAPPSLSLDHLRSYVDTAVKLYLNDRRHMEDSSGSE